MCSCPGCLLQQRFGLFMCWVSGGFPHVWHGAHLALELLLVLGLQSRLAVSFPPLQGPNLPSQSTSSPACAPSTAVQQQGPGPYCSGAGRYVQCWLRLRMLIANTLCVRAGPAMELQKQWKLGGYTNHQGGSACGLEASQDIYRIQYPCHLVMAGPQQCPTNFNMSQVNRAGMCGLVRPGPQHRTFIISRAFGFSPPYLCSS